MCGLGARFEYAEWRKARVNVDYDADAWVGTPHVIEGGPVPLWFRERNERHLLWSAVGESAWFRELAKVVPVVAHPPDAVSGPPTYVVMTPRARATASP